MPAPFAYEVGRSEFENGGFQPYLMVWEVDYSDVVSNAISLIVPANKYIVDVGILVGTAWDGGTTETIDIGDGTDADEWVDATDFDPATANTFAHSLGSANDGAKGCFSTNPQTLKLSFAAGTYVAGTAKVFALVYDFEKSWRESL